MEGKWISIDGCGCSGKTTLVNNLKLKYPNLVYVPEFSTELTGITLKKAIEQGAYIIPDSYIGSSLLFLSDYFLMCEAIIYPNIKKGNTVVSDRGFLSKIAVQDAIMSDKYDRKKVVDFLVPLFKLGPIPDISINLDISMDLLKKRILQRDKKFYIGQEQLMEKTKKRIEEYADIFNINMFKLYNNSDIEDFISHFNKYI